MIAVGFDLVDIARFAHWHMYSEAQLSKLFCASEIEYCLAIEAKSAERFAVRFAAKEALYKALCSMAVCKLPFITVARHCNVSREFSVDWSALKSHGLELQGPAPAVKVSLSHSKHSAGAVVILECRAFLDNSCD